MKKSILPIAFLLVGLIVISCQKKAEESTAEVEEASLRNVFADEFTIGTALGFRQIMSEDQKELDLIAREYSSVTPENVMKFERIHPQPDSFNFELPDKLVADAMKNDQQIIGHTLAWHSQTPNWLFEDEDGNPVDSITLYSRMKEHIQTVVGRYKGKIHGWDVLNEALNGDGTLRESKYKQITGEGYIYKAFQYANEADPDMELYYNDYSMQGQPKVEGAIRIANEIRAKGLRIDGIGMQGHWGIGSDDPPIELIEQSITKIADAGYKVMITELDIDVLPNPYGIQGAEISDNFESNKEANPYVDGLPDSVNQLHAQRFADLFKLFLKHKDKITRVTFWGVHDGQSWKNNWPARGRTNYCHVIGRDLEPKLAYDSIIALTQ